ncbi:hypothetical protein ABIA31_008633 [Catenulispora sp. MAP5-51]|uniref:hypothetical protein n=1 Tax=Catenulispora sp. MAP5-51 TaxID=3156298 RepID=UPI003512F765
MTNHPIAARRRATIVSSAALLLGMAAAVTATAASSGGADRPAGPPSRYQDYIGGQPNEQCSVPPAQRNGGWVCPPADGRR